MTGKAKPNDVVDLETAAATVASPTPPKLFLSPVGELRPHPANARKHSRKQIGAIAASIEAFKFNSPVVVDADNQVLAGHGRLEAAKLLGLTAVPTVRLDHLTDEQARAFMLADNKTTDRSSWDDKKLALQLRELCEADLDFEVVATGFELPEIDLRIQSLDDGDIDADDDFQASKRSPCSKIGDCWTAGEHRIFCGDSRDPSSFSALLGDRKASAVFTDPPYNVAINGHVRSRDQGHSEFQMASGEMSDAKFEDFLSTCLRNLSDWTSPGSLIYACMDWRHMRSIQAAALRNELNLLNVCVWVKTNGGMGSFYRSQHELVFVFRNGDAQHRNNIQLGRFGRYRTNVWNYAGANTFARARTDDDFGSHPTVKPVRLVADALMDSTSRGQIVLDPFLGSGSTLLAAERTGRHCFGIELDPVHVDTAISRWQRLTGKVATNQNGQSLSQLRAAVEPQ